MTKRSKIKLLGMGFDARDGHKRILQAEDATIVGGSAETHERMTEAYLKTKEDLRKKGRDFQTADPREIRDLLREHTK